MLPMQSLSSCNSSDYNSSKCSDCHYSTELRLVFSAFVVAGFTTFIPKYLEFQYGVSASLAALIVGKCMFGISFSM